MAEVEIDLVVDSNALIDLIKIGVLNIICKLPGYRFFVVKEVYNEITWPEQKKILNDAINGQFVCLVSLVEINELELFSRLSTCLVSGEAASLTYAYCHKAFLLSDENNSAFLRELRKTISGSKLRRTPDLLAEAIIKNLFSLLDLEKRIEELEANILTPRDLNDVEHLRHMLSQLEKML